MVIFRENTEDIYAGIEWAGRSRAEAKKVHRASCRRRSEGQEDPLPGDRAASASSRSRSEGTERLVRAAIEYAIHHKRKSVTLVHKGNIMKFTEGAFRDWGYALAKRELRRARATAAGTTAAASRRAGQVLVKDAIADITLQQVLTRPEEFDVIATLNLNGDYLSDALAAQVGGIGIAPGGNINYVTGHAVFEATHGTAPKYADLDKVNPGSVILSGEMMLEHLGWNEAADLIVKGMDEAIAQQDRDLRLRAPDGEAPERSMLEVRATFEHSHHPEHVRSPRRVTTMATQQEDRAHRRRQHRRRARALAARKELGDVVLFDIPAKENFAKGKALDLEQNGAVLGYDADDHRHRRTGPTAPAPTSSSSPPASRASPGMSRDDLLSINLPDHPRRRRQRRRSTAPTRSSSSSRTRSTRWSTSTSKVTGFAQEQVVGMAGVLDSARFQLFLAREAGVQRQGRARHGARRPRRRHGPGALATAPINGVPVDAAHRQGQARRDRRRARARAAARSSSSWARAPTTRRRRRAVAMAEAYLLDQKRLLACGRVPRRRVRLQGPLHGRARRHRRQGRREDRRDRAHRRRKRRCSTRA